ncbi:MAG TPA: lipopolysaccharide core heptose(II) kinase RfaY [Pyrinomonadaceae bacterium]|jgi:serine/threonine protein kinase|nr:lipopolysaccharide core heptose(II) kinase RfaY [Pyrinomonadaceae bacterium]
MMSRQTLTYWPSASHFAEAIQCPGICFSNSLLRQTLPAVDRLGMPLVTSGQFAYVYKLKMPNGVAYAVRCFRGYLGDREQRYQAIDEHLQSHHIPALASFAYEAEGILVRGRRYPILFMEWIEGPTLDVYLDEMVTRSEVVLHLADEWLKLVRALSEAGIVHGDLQHGNIIVERGNLRLVDLDGMFVPAMTGWTASELGHQHYQHPSRDINLFNPSLDNFSALVIYLSLISLAERPELWAEHHDENLLFTRSDFLDPSSSALFKKIKEIGPEHRQLAEVLELSAQVDPAMVPSLLDLASTKSRLPSWMAAPLDLEITERTREAPRVDAPHPDSPYPTWTPWQAQRARPVPVTPGSVAVQSVFSGTGILQPAQTQRGVSTDPTQVGRNALRYARELLGRTFLWWYWGLYFLLKILGMEYLYSLILTFFLVGMASLAYGFVRATQEAQDASASTLPFTNPNPYLPPTNATPSFNTGQYFPLPSDGQPADALPTAATALNQIIGNSVLSIYHLPDCDWVAHISKNSRVDFDTVVEAVNAGYRPCRVCQP